jgi:DNA-binding transcriptional MerR regulator
MTSTAAAPERTELSIDELAARSAVPSRTIREYQTLALLPPPERRGRTGVYRPAHLHRLQLIARLQTRGYSLAGIRDLLGAWGDGSDLGDVLGLAPDELVHVDEPGAKVTLTSLAHVVPALVPDRVDELLAVGLIALCGPEAYCVSSPSLLQLSADMLAAGYSPDQVIALLGEIGAATASIASATAGLLAKPPKGLSDAALDRLASRGRGLLAHGVGRLTIYNLGQRLEPDAPARRATRRD